ncbi:LAFE_0F15016g1_1 [Lachancea fermentati]|uniref:LAFE_0F15016g1_1 n=1 Tax=Lachancea fermentati TaxID=4955 RepID=A0A1G4MGE0_LACFM|nr:LAFE_0F15016g1_1 [Lachancea fermentati]
MPSVKVKDYFDNDDNGLWSWYLSNLREGHFEELTNNVLKFTLLRRFLNEQLMADTVQFNKKLLLVSIPDTVHENTGLLENFLRDYFHLDDLQYIQIKKLTRERCYNHENHYLISDNLNNFNDRSFLEFGHRARMANSNTNTRILPQNSGNQYSVLSGETGFDSLKSSQEDPESPRALQPSHVVEETIGSPLSSPASPLRMERVKSIASSDDSADESSEIVINFSQKLRPKPYRSLVRTVLSDDAEPTTSADVSIYSDDLSSYEGEILAHTITREEDATSSVADGDSISELSSVDHSLNSLSYQSELSQDTRSMVSIFPSISISDKFGRFRLVLQSILIQHPDTRQIYTAVRQSNNDPTVAHVNDDWLLYDEIFSMDNLQMLTLHDVLEVNRFFPKILFYSLVMITEEVAQEAQQYYPLPNSHNPKPIPSASTLSENTLKLQNTLNSTISNMNSQLSPTSKNGYSRIAEDTEQYYPDIDDDYDEDSDDGRVVQLYAATRTNSNNTTAHRSIRTVNSIGDWAFHHDSARNPLSNVSTTEDYEFSDDKIRRAISKSPSKNALTKSATLGSLSTVERSKSTPLPSILRTLSSFDDEALYWKKKVEKFKRKRRARPKKSDANCVLM